MMDAPYVTLVNMQKAKAMNCANCVMPVNMSRKQQETRLSVLSVQLDIHLKMLVFCASSVPRAGTRTQEIPAVGTVLQDIMQLERLIPNATLVMQGDICRMKGKQSAWTVQQDIRQWMAVLVVLSVIVGSTVKKGIPLVEVARQDSMDQKRGTLHAFLVMRASMPTVKIMTSV